MIKITTKEKMMYLVVNIGCIECGVSSEIVGLFKEKEKAERIVKECDKHYDWRESGQNSFEVFLLPKSEIIHTDYPKIQLEKN